MKCPSCGLENDALHKYCSYCGRSLAPPIDLRDPRLSEGRRKILDAISDQSTRDRVCSSTWIIVPIMIMILAVVVGFVAIFAELSNIYDDPDWDPTEDPFPGGFAWGYGIIAAGEVCYTVLLAILAYMLIDRLNTHFDRERSLRTGLISLLTPAADTPEKAAAIGYELWQMNGLNVVKEDRHDARYYGIIMGSGAVLYLLVVAMMSMDTATRYLGLIGLIGLLSIMYFIVNMYVFYFLGRDLYEHHQRWMNFSQHARNAMVKLGFFPVPEPNTGKWLPKRSFVLYLILTIFLGIFVWYWWYTLIKDPNEHFKDHAEFEAQLLQSIGHGQS